MTTTSRFMVPLPGNAAVTFCSRPCGTYWCAASTGRAGTQVQFEEVPASPTCRHCAWCARMLPSSLVCTWHGEDCPPFRWEVTLSGKVAVLELMRLAGVDELPLTARAEALARMWDCLEYVWSAQEKPDPIGTVEEVWSRREVWLQSAS